MKIIMESNDTSWKLFERDDGGKILSVLCGGVGMYVVEIELNNYELASFQEKGRYFLDEISFDIMENPEKYKNREIL